MPAHTEHDFETAIEAGLIDRGGYEKRDPSAYDETMALFPDDAIAFIQASQPKRWKQLETLLADKTAATVLDSLTKERLALLLRSRGGADTNSPPHPQAHEGSADISTSAGGSASVPFRASCLWFFSFQ